MFKTESNLLEPDFAPHFQAWKADPAPHTASKMLGVLEPVLRNALTTYAPGQQSSPNLYSKARRIALEALPKYDPSKAKLRTFMMTHLQGLRRAAGREAQPISIPEQILLDKGHLDRMTNELTDKLGRDPSDSELADHAGLSLKRITKVRQLRPTVNEGMFAPRGGEEDNYYDPAVEPFNNEPDPWTEFVYHDLDPQEQIILEHSLGMHGKPVLSNQLIAKKLKLSPGAISQRKTKIQARLDLRDELSPF